MNLLLFVHTREEWVAARQRLEATSGSSAPAGTVLLLGGIHSEDLDPAPPDGCRCLTPSDFDVDVRQAWDETRQLQDALWASLPPDPERQLAVVSEQPYGEILLLRCYLEALVEATMEAVHPDEVWVATPPLMQLVRSRAPQALELAWVVRRVAGRRGVRCPDGDWFARTSWMLAQVAALERLVRTAVVAMQDVKARIRRRKGGQLDTPEALSGRVVLTNLDMDLTRQFDPARVPVERRPGYVAWRYLAEDLVPLPGLLEQEVQSAIWYGLGEGPEQGTARLPGSLAIRALLEGRASRPLLPVLRQHDGVWHCLPSGGPAPAGVPDRLWEYLGAPAFACERLLNWRRLAWAARCYVRGLEVLPLLAPRLVVASDTLDISRALLLAARSLGIPTLGTSHSVLLMTDVLTPLHGLADTHAVFSALVHPWCARVLPGQNPKRMVYHDRSGRQLDPAPVVREWEGRTRPRVWVMTASVSGGGGTLRPEGNRIFGQERLFRSELYALARVLAGRLPHAEMAIKSHPGGDEFALFDEIAAAFPETVVHWREPLNSRQPVPADVVVFYNSISTAYFDVVEQNAPVLGHWGVLTPLAARLFAITGLLGSAQSEELAGLIQSILDSPTGSVAAEARARALSVYRTFVQEPSGGLDEVSRLALGEVGGETAPPEGRSSA